MFIVVISLDKHKIIFSILIIITAFVFLASVYSTNSQGKQDNIVRADNIEFNTTSDSNITHLQLYNKTEYDDGSYSEQFVDQNFSGYNIWIWNLSTADDWYNFTNHIKKNYESDPYETINGIVVYTSTAVKGEHVGEPRFQSYIINQDLKTIVEFSTPDQNETVKIATSLKFH